MPLTGITHKMCLIFILCRKDFNFSRLGHEAEGIKVGFLAANCSWTEKFVCEAPQFKCKIKSDVVRELKIGLLY